MIHPSHDPAITSIRARPGRRCYGMGLGIILLDDVYPGFPGDVRNASAYPFPIQYEIATGVDIPRLVIEEDKAPCLEPVRRAALRLEEMGCRAIAAECGYFAYFQREIAASVRVPVFMSSLLQVPFAQQLIGPDRVVGILMADATYLTERHLASVGIVPGSNTVVGGAMEGRRCVEFDHLWTAGSAPIPPRPITPGRRPSWWPWRSTSVASTRPWARWCWSAPASRLSLALCSGRSISRSLVGAHCWTTRTRWSCIGITTDMCSQSCRCERIILGTVVNCAFRRLSF